MTTPTVNNFYRLLARQTENWSADDYASDYRAISEIMDWACDPETGAFRFLRQPQFQALKVYWYLRLVEKTPKIFELYQRFFSESEILEPFGLAQPSVYRFLLDNKGDYEALWDRVRTDDEFVRSYKLEALRETLTLDYPSYILALAMGAGKTILIGTIIATEFAMGMEYPDGPFVQNALVFAPGKTIIESLRELLSIPYQKLLPPRLYKSFAASFRPVFTRDGEKDIPVVRGSLFNVVVTNTEKIRIQKETVRKADIGSLFGTSDDEARAEVANLRLQAIASLPHLAVFSDEAHHTYGQSLDSELKRVRQTVDYLHQKSPNLVCVVNTTGTPYYQRQPLKDVVVWYGLSQGIRDGILKDVSDNIQQFEFAGHTDKFLSHVIVDFFKDYGSVRLPNGAPAKLAIYFPQTSDLREMRAAIDKALVEGGQGPAVSLVNTSDQSLTKAADIEAFNRLNDPAAPQRVILLVNKGTEGWNCPSLFACALARKLTRSNNFVLQAATRCLRQVPGNVRKARIYLSKENVSILDTQLRETYGESIADLSHAGQDTRTSKIVLNKLHVPPLLVTQTVRTVVRRQPDSSKPLVIARPKQSSNVITKRTLTIQERQATRKLLTQVGSATIIEDSPDALDAYTVSVDLSGRYRLSPWVVYDELRQAYSTDDIPLADIPDLALQLEKQVSIYDVEEEQIDVALALVKPDGFDKEFDITQGKEIYTAEIRYPKDKEKLLLSLSEMFAHNPHNLGFHYTPYNFSSNPEKSFFEEILRQLTIDPQQVDDIYFTGAIRDKQKTDFYVEYKDTKGKLRTYTPDFVIRLKTKVGRRANSGKVLIVEIKSEHDRAHKIDGENGKKALAMRKWEALDPERLKYQMIFTSTDSVTYDQVERVRALALKDCE